ncbi:hypothetical protein [uncultured Sphingomonas sp.]|uniref:hypothetical protein n=1 Tax=uncultured Sphingomonas sp. TaxID=158754 RepID=UPI002599C736|nr:hypothetical protein [uncultured Sphingomonas sp.]
MTIPRRGRVGAIAFALAATAMPALAQDQTQTPVPASTVQPQAIPGLNNYRFSLPDPQGSPTPAPTATPTPAATPAPAPSPSAVRTQRPAPTPQPTATPEARGTPGGLPSPLPTPTAAATLLPGTGAASTSVARQPTAPIDEPSPVPTGAATTAPEAVPPSASERSSSGEVGGLSLWLAGLVAIAAIGGGILVLRRRRSEVASPERLVEDTIEPEPVEPAPVLLQRAAPIPAVPDAPGADAAPSMLERGRDHLPALRSRLVLRFEPRRAGFNLITATVEGELVVRNDGDFAASGIRIGTALLEAGSGRESEVAAFFAQPVVRPAAPPFALAPGEERRVRIVVAHGREAIRGIPANGRAMFVPVVAINALHGGGDAPGQAGRAFAVGVERADSDRLMPFWLDVPPRMYDGLAVRPYGPVVEQ